MEQNPAQPTPEQPPQEISIPENVFRPLGEGLRQLLLPSLANIDSLVGKPEVETAQTDPITSEMQSATHDISELLGKFATAKNFSVRPFGGGYEFNFEEKIEDRQSLPAQTVHTGETTVPLIAAMQHEFGNKLALLVGYGELEKTRGSSEKIRETGGKIHEAATQMQQTLDRITHANAKDIEITSNKTGTIVLNPIYPQKQENI